MFEFIFKMFAQGNAAIPSKGMSQIPKMLRGKLKKTEIMFNSPINFLEGKKIHLLNGEILHADRIIVATQPDSIIPQLRGQFPVAQKVINLYFHIQKSFMARPMIGLLAGDGHLINNLVFMNDVSPEYAPRDKALLSVTVLETTLGEKELIKGVQGELEIISGIKAEYFKFLKSYFIDYALPSVNDPKYSIPSTECKIFDDVFLAGDYLLNGSINAAMTSGRIAAQALVQSYMPTH
jgi:protoporphyrinogen oxidase